MPEPLSEIRTYLLRYARGKRILVSEYVARWRGEDEFYCHLQLGEDPAKTATAISLVSAENAIVMAFLSLGNPEINFLDETPSTRIGSEREKG